MALGEGNWLMQPLQKGRKFSGGGFFIQLLYQRNSRAFYEPDDKTGFFRSPLFVLMMNGFSC